MRVCPHCGVIVSNLGKHLRRGRCKEQHKHYKSVLDRPARGKRKVNKG